MQGVWRDREKEPASCSRADETRRSSMARADLGRSWTAALVSMAPQEGRDKGLS